MLSWLGPLTALRAAFTYVHKSKAFIGVNEKRNSEQFCAPTNNFCPGFFLKFEKKFYGLFVVMVNAKCYAIK